MSLIYCAPSFWQLYLIFSVESKQQPSRPAVAAEPIETPECREVGVILRPRFHPITDQSQTSARGYGIECIRFLVWEYGLWYSRDSIMIRLHIVCTSFGAFVLREFDS